MADRPPLPGPVGGAAGDGGATGHVARGRLLVAAPRLSDPNFVRTVVLVLEHDEDGTLGLVLNRPTEVALDEVVPAWGRRASAPAVVFTGGPVSPQVAVGMARRPDDDQAADWRPVVDGVGLVELSEEPKGEPPPGRIFAGHAGWGPGQLERELAAGAWFVVDGRGDDVLGDHPHGLWRRVLRRQPGALRLLATFPADPADN